jgi:hypothetical protein
VAELNGPAAVQVKVEWTTRFECSPTRNPGGTSTFTVFPDGRLVRHDVIVDDGPMPISASLCDCVESSEFSFAPYWTLKRMSLDGFYRVKETREDPPDPGVEIGNQLTSCVEGDMFQVAFAWSKVNNTAIRGRGELISFLRELEITSSDLVAFRYEDASAVFIEHDSCATALARTKEYTEPPELTIAEVATPLSISDGIYGGGDRRGVEVPDGPVELSGPTPGSFAVWLRFPRSADAVRATRTGAKGEWYLPQKVDDRSWIVWFRDPLPMNEKITIVPD